MPPKGSKRKRADGAPQEVSMDSMPPPSYVLEQVEKMAHTDATEQPVEAVTNPDRNPEVLDAKSALRASPDAEEVEHPREKALEELDVSKIAGSSVNQIKDDIEEDKPDILQEKKASKTKAKPKSKKAAATVKVEDKAYENGAPPATPIKREEKEDSPLSSLDGKDDQLPPAKKPKKTPTKSAVAAKKGSDEIKAFIAAQAAEKAAVKKEENDGEQTAGGEDGEGDNGPPEDADKRKLEARRPPPINSDYLPLPWKGRLGYACLNTYLRFSNPPVFASRTCRIASILDHRHPLTDPTQPEHATKNRPDKNQPASIERGQQYVEALGVANAKDVIKMLRWNAKYGIRFMRLSSEMFPFASHDEYGYKLEGFAKEVLGEVGKVAGELGCRLTTHPGQFTQLGSPRQQVIDNAVRDLEYHTEMLSLLNLPDQLDRDAVMILHLGGVFGDKEATLQRFKENYLKLSDDVKKRLVLENDDVSWSVHDLLPVCEELNIPMVLDFHHHNIIFDSTQLREGTKDIMELYPRIKATWTRKNITQKMHYSEPCPEAITGRERRKHNPRPITLPPCADDMDLMIEAKDKEQAVFELMRTFKLPGWDTFNNIVPHERDDDNKPEPKKAKPKKKTKKQLQAEAEDPSLIKEEEEPPSKPIIPEEEVGMGGPDGRVYWPPGMEEWLRPKKREIKKKGADAADEETGQTDAYALAHPTPMNVKQRQAAKKKAKQAENGDTDVTADEAHKTPAKRQTKAKPTANAAAGGKKISTPAKGRGKKAAPKSDDEASTVAESPGEEEADEDALSEMDYSAEETDKTAATMKSTGSVRRTGRRAAVKGTTTYKEGSGSETDVD